MFAPNNLKLEIFKVAKFSVQFHRLSLRSKFGKLRNICSTSNLLHTPFRISLLELNIYKFDLSELNIRITQHRQCVTYY